MYIQESMEHIKSILANQEIWKDQEKKDRDKAERIYISSDDEDMNTPEPANDDLVENTNPEENSDTDDDECIITKLKVNLNKSNILKFTNLFFVSDNKPSKRFGCHQVPRSKGKRLTQFYLSIYYDPLPHKYKQEVGTHSSHQLINISYQKYSD